jgi:uncharacterized protein YhaN
MEEQQKRAKAELDTLLGRVREMLLSAGRPEASDSEWLQLAQELKHRTRRLRIDYNLASQKLEDLGIDELDYLEQAPNRGYSRRREEEVAGELEQVEEAIRTHQAGSRELREQLIEHLGRATALAESIEVVARAIEEKKQEYRHQIRELLARMIAGHVVAEVLDGVREIEDRQLQSTLNDPRITELTKKFTAGRYGSVSLAEEGLYIESETESYALSDMSSGAREQVLLALRIGLASILCGQRSLFLILDDAFQYSDWQRREQLVGQAVQIVRSGWQVIYLTMDDDIRDRFRKAAAGLEEGIFRLIEL